MNNAEQKQKFQELLNNIMNETGIPKVFKPLITSQINTRLTQIKDDEIEEVIKAAGKFCVFGIEQFANLLGYKVNIEFIKHHAEPDGQSDFIRPHRERENSISEISSNTI